MNIDENLMKTLEVMRNKDISIEIQRMYFNFIKEYLKSQQYKSIKLDKESSKAYLLRLKQLGKTDKYIESCSESINFFLDNVLGINNISKIAKEDYKEIKKTDVEEEKFEKLEIESVIKKDKEVLDKEVLDKEVLDKEVLDKEVLDKEVLDKEVLDKEVLDKEVLDKESIKVKDKKQLPLVLSVQEVSNILECISNPVHNLMVSFLYSTGVRLSELVNFKRCDINFESNVVVVKSKKSRNTILAKKLKYRLIEYFEDTEFKTEYLFETNRGTKYSKASVQKIVRENSKFIKKNISPQTFRNSFATHLLESGINVKIIQKLLGHSKLETTMVYAKVADTSLIRIVSPFDRL
jgi:integrase